MYVFHTPNIHDSELVAGNVVDKFSKVSRTLAVIDISIG